MVITGKHADPGSLDAFLDQHRELRVLERVENRAQLISRMGIAHGIEVPATAAPDPRPCRLDHHRVGEIGLIECMATRVHNDRFRHGNAQLLPQLQRPVLVGGQLQLRTGRRADSTGQAAVLDGSRQRQRRDVRNRHHGLQSMVSDGSRDAVYKSIWVHQGVGYNQPLLAVP